MCFILPITLFRKGEGTCENNHASLSLAICLRPGYPCAQNLPLTEKLCPTMNFCPQIWHSLALLITACSGAGSFCCSRAGASPLEVAPPR